VAGRKIAVSVGSNRRESLDRRLAQALINQFAALAEEPSRHR
jgi:hypothetical protein